jgi:hypothetical protein
MAAKQFRSIDVDETGDVVCTTACVATSIVFFNDTGAQIYAHVYDKASAAVVGTDTPVKTYPLPTKTGITLYWNKQSGPGFENGISVGGSTTLEGATGPAANGLICNIDYDT